MIYLSISVVVVARILFFTNLWLITTGPTSRLSCYAGVALAIATVASLLTGIGAEANSLVNPINGLSHIFMFGLAIAQITYYMQEKGSSMQ